MLGDMAIPGGGPSQLSEPLGPVHDLATLTEASSTDEEKMLAATGLATTIILKKKCKLLRNPRLHHAWPQYLQGPYKQELQKLSKSLHDKYHSGLDKHLPRRSTSEYYRTLPPQQQAENFAKFLKYTEEFDKKHGTHLVEALRKVAAAEP